MNLKSFALIMLLIFGAAACDEDNNSSQFQTDDEIIEQGFREADLDGDGMIDQDEVEMQLQNDFNRMDQDMDGVITDKDHTGPEYMGEPVKKEERSELSCDANDDETLTLEEYTECINETVIDIMDSDNDGFITLEEGKEFKKNQP